MEGKRKVGRPRNEERGLERRDNVFKVRLTDEDFAALEELTKRTHMTKSEAFGTLLHYYGSRVISQ